MQFSAIQLDLLRSARIGVTPGTPRALAALRELEECELVQCIGKHRFVLTGEGRQILQEQLDISCGANERE